MKLKNKLLELNLVIDNKYLDKYVNLIESNLNTRREKFKTQRHHTVPKYYFKINNLPTDNSKENLVNLLYKDHVLAHYYLAKCAKSKNFRIGMFISLQFMGISENNIADFITDEGINDWYSIVLKEKAARHSRKMKGNMPIPWNKGGGCYTEEQLNKFRENLRKLNTHYWSGKHLPKYMREKISNTLKGFHPTEETRKKISLARKRVPSNTLGKIWVNNGTINRVVYPDEASSLLSDGWQKGPMKKH